jgi:hypothetical protein
VEVRLPEGAKANHKPPYVGDARLPRGRPRGPRRCGLWTCRSAIYP